VASGDGKLVYDASAAMTITLASLAASSGLTVGRQSTVIDNTTNLYLDYLVSGKVKTGTSPTAGVIEVWAFSLMEDTPTWPDGLGASDAGYTAATADVKRAYSRLLASIPTDATARTYWFGQVSIAAAFGGVVPKKWGVTVFHSTVAALDATGGNHAIWQTGVYMNTAP
jgi:hypothetical protein